LFLLNRPKLVLLVHFHNLLLSYHSIFSRRILVTDHLFVYSRLLLSYHSIFSRSILVTDHLFVYSRLLPSYHSIFCRSILVTNHLCVFTFALFELQIATYAITWSFISVL
jgi:hypothetical protein